MADKLIINCMLGETNEQNFTEEEKQQRLKQQTEITIQYQQISEDVEQIALLTIENENLKDRINNLETKILGGK